MKLRKWVENLLVIIQLILIILLSAEVENMSLFVLSKIVIFVGMMLNHKIIIKYTNFYN